MAVTGELVDLPLPELLNMMRHRGGKLLLLQTQLVSEMELHFTPGYLCGFMVDKHIIKSEAQVVDKLVAVTAQPVGNFSFTPEHASSLLGSVRLQVDRLALIIVGQVDEISVNREMLAPPHRIFRLEARAEPAQFEEQNLAEFFHETVELLKCGISAEKLASIDQISVEQAQLYLYKLSLLGLVAPGRKDDLWAQLDSALQPKSTALKLTLPRKIEARDLAARPCAAQKQAQNALSARPADPPGQQENAAIRPSAGPKVWSPNRTEEGLKVTNRQRAIPHLLPQVKVVPPEES